MNLPPVHNSPRGGRADVNQGPRDESCEDRTQRSTLRFATGLPESSAPYNTRMEQPALKVTKLRTQQQNKLAR